MIFSEIQKRIITTLILLPVTSSSTKNNTFNLYCKGKEIMLFQKIDRKNDTNSKKKPNSIEIF